MRYVAVLVAVTLAVSAGVFAVRTASDAERVAGDTVYWTKRLNGCQVKGTVTAEQVMDLTYDCLYDAMKDAIWNRSYDDFNEALRPLAREDVMLEYVCHIPGHDLGREIVRKYNNDYHRAIVELASDLCGSGIIHGIYDIFGEAKQTDDDWKMVGDACVFSNQKAFNACGDAIGHAAYESTGRDLGAAMQICDLMSQPWVQYTCANGAYMQANFPQSTKLKKIATPPAKEDPALWGPFVEFCDRQTFKNVDTMNGCYGGAGWVMGNTIYTSNATFNKERVVLGYQIDEMKAVPEQEELVLSRAGAAIDVCLSGKMGGEAKLDCVADMLSRMPIFFYRGGIDNLERYCVSLTGDLDAVFLDRCIAGAQQHVPTGDITELVRRHEGALRFVHVSNPRLGGEIAATLGLPLPEKPVR